MAKFDGQTGISVPESVLPSETFPPHKFTIATWMRHRDNKALDKHTKEHIICKADDHRKYFTYFSDGANYVRKFDDQLFEAKNRVFKFDYQKMNMFESIQCLKK